ncbi:hypothetical protein HOY80DRAFT_989954 [Tuber brumale]|nr:hypothetical protein HOY80DRAFT_989954 [Tuber brumale]
MNFFLSFSFIFLCASPLFLCSRPFTPYLLHSCYARSSSYRTLLHRILFLSVMSPPPLFFCVGVLCLAMIGLVCLHKANYYSIMICPGSGMLVHCACLM